MKGQLKAQVAAGAEWTLGEKILTALVQLVVRVWVLRLVMPDDLKVIAILMAITSFALVVVDSGFSQMLLRKQDAEPSDFKSVFLFNILSSVAIYLLLLVATPFLADYYAMPILGEVAPLFFLMIPLNALGVIQYTILSRRFCFARLSKIIFAAQGVSGVAAVVLATMGWGVWALVWQQVVLMGVRSALLWWWGGWSPAGRGSLGALAKMAPYSVSVMASDLVTALYNKVPQLVLGKIYLDATLGYYDQAIKLKDLPVQSAMQSVQQVTFPALARIAHEQPKFSESFRQVLMVVAYAIFPVMLGMAAVAHDLFYLLIGEQWMPTAICRPKRNHEGSVSHTVTAFTPAYIAVETSAMGNSVRRARVQRSSARGKAAAIFTTKSNAAEATKAHTTASTEWKIARASTTVIKAFLRSSRRRITRPSAFTFSTL